MNTVEPHWWRDELWISCEIIWTDGFYSHWKHCFPTEFGRLWLRAAGINYGVVLNNGGSGGSP